MTHLIMEDDPAKWGKRSYSAFYLVTYDYRFDMVNERKKISTNYWELPTDYKHVSSNWVRPLASESWWIVPGTLDPRVN